MNTNNNTYSVNLQCNSLVQKVVSYITVCTRVSTSPHKEQWRHCDLRTKNNNLKTCKLNQICRLVKTKNMQHKLNKLQQIYHQRSNFWDKLNYPGTRKNTILNNEIGIIQLHVDSRSKLCGTLHYATRLIECSSLNKLKYFIASNDLQD